MLISIGIPTYNRLADLQECLASVFCAAKLLAEPVEILVSDNASADGTGDWLRTHRFEMENIKVSHWSNPENIGAVKNIKKVIEQATGDYLFLLADDDLLLPNALTLLRKYIISDSPGFIKFAITTFLIKTKSCFYCGLTRDTKDAGSCENFVKILNFSHILSGTAIKRNSLHLEIINNSDNAYPTSEILALNAGNCLFIAEPVVFHKWENEIFWHLDVDMSSNSAMKKHLDRDSQLALLNTPQGFFNERGRYLLCRWILTHYGYIEPAIRQMLAITDFEYRIFKLRVMIRQLRKKWKKWPA